MKKFNSFKRHNVTAKTTDNTNDRRAIIETDEIMNMCLKEFNNTSDSLNGIHNYLAYISHSLQTLLRLNDCSSIIGINDESLPRITKYYIEQVEIYANKVSAKNIRSLIDEVNSIISGYNDKLKITRFRLQNGWTIKFCKNILDTIYENIDEIDSIACDNTSSDYIFTLFHTVIYPNISIINSIKELIDKLTWC